VNGRTIPYHLIDIAEPGWKYSVYEYQRDFTEVYMSLKKKDIFPVVCGGSGMYIDSIVSSYRMMEVPRDEDLRRELELKSMNELDDLLSAYRKPHNITDLKERERTIRAIEIEKYHASKQYGTCRLPGIKSVIAGILFSREERRARITRRLRDRLDGGMIDEVRLLIEKGVDTETLLYYGLEYKYITLHLQGRLAYDEMFRLLETAIHKFAKRQMTWFRSMERKGLTINWIDGTNPLNVKVDTILNLLYH
ncbi:MAG: hypothetical protein JW705_02480, partial [Methanosarcinaceae archaeon]|nr:hypothetical protein [Methanosarcinaceae archaeon]